MILNATLLLDQVSDASCRPKPGFIAQMLGTSLQRLPDTLPVTRSKPRLAAGTARPLQTGTSFPLQLSRPAAHRLPVDAHLAGNFRLVQTLGEQSRRPSATLFQGHKVSSYSGWISHAVRLP